MNEIESDKTVDVTMVDKASTWCLTVSVSVDVIRSASVFYVIVINAWQPLLFIMLADCKVPYIGYTFLTFTFIMTLGALLARARSCLLKFLVSKSSLLSTDEAKSSYGDELKSLNIEQHELIFLHVFQFHLLNFLFMWLFPCAIPRFP